MAKPPKPKTFEEDAAYWMEQARQLPGAPGWGSRFGDNVAAGFGRKLAASAMSDYETLSLIQDVPEMPLRDDAAAKTVARKSAARQRRRRGRESTILTTFNVEDGGVLGA